MLCTSDGVLRRKKKNLYLNFSKAHRVVRHTKNVSGSRTGKLNNENK